MKYKAQKTRDYRPHVSTLHGAKELLKLSAELPDESLSIPSIDPIGRKYFLCLGSLLLSAFAFEGYLNFLGERLFPSWDDFERSLASEPKAMLLIDRITPGLDKGSRPFQTIKALISFRNKMAHLKPGELREESQCEELEAGYEPVKSDVEKFCTEENAKRCIEDVQEMMVLLYDRSGLRQGHPLAFGHQSGTITVA